LEFVSAFRIPYSKFLLPTAALILAVAVGGRAQPTPPPVHRGEHRSFEIDNFRTESGVTLPKARLVYGTFGRLNAARDNVVLLPSHYMANHHGYDWLTGPGEALDTSTLFLVATELFGNGQSSSPSNTPEPFHGPRFPVTTIRDNVEAVHQLLTKDLGITHVRAVIGFSMGAQQAFQWAVSHPRFADRIVATAGTAKAWPHGIVRLEGQIAALTADPAFNGGDYTSPPRKGMEAYGMVWLGWLYSQEWWRREMWKARSPSNTLEQEIESRRRTFFANNDANDLILQARTWQRHDVGTTPGFGGDVERALRSITVPVLYMPAETDLYFPIGDARFEASFIPRVSLVPIPSLWGHTAGAGGNPADRAFLNQQIGRFLAASSAARHQGPGRIVPTRARRGRIDQRRTRSAPRAQRKPVGSYPLRASRPLRSKFVGPVFSGYAPYDD
jgi:homoserine O-acetyltransferase